MLFSNLNRLVLCVYTRLHFFNEDVRLIGQAPGKERDVPVLHLDKQRYRFRLLRGWRFHVVLKDRAFVWGRTVVLGQVPDKPIKSGIKEGFQMAVY